LDVRKFFESAAFFLNKRPRSISSCARHLTPPPPHLKFQLGALPHEVNEAAALADDFDLRNVSPLPEIDLELLNGHIRCSASARAERGGGVNLGGW
jgi:hypothetical protein